MRGITRLTILCISILLVGTIFDGHAAGTLEEAGVRRQQDSRSDETDDHTTMPVDDPLIERPVRESDPQIDTDRMDSDQPSSIEAEQSPKESMEDEQTPVSTEKERASQPIPLSETQFKTLIMADTTLPAPIGMTNSPMAIINDLDDDGYPEGYVLSIDEPSVEGRRFEGLNDFSRMLDTRTRTPTYYIVIYTQQSRGIHRILEVELGSYPVLDAFNTRSIHTHRESPLCVYSSFQTQNGQRTEWTIFNSPKEYSTFSLRESATVSFVVNDIDDDDYVDILLFERVLEEGTGYETLISWYRWSGTEYLREGTINIVRNLKAFLQTARRMILRQDWDAFVKLSLDPDQLREDSYTEMSPFELAWTAFGFPVPPDVGETDSQLRQRYSRNPITAVVLPEFYENPFTRTPDGAYAFQTRVKLVYENRKEKLLTMEIFMRKNPFEGGQFYVRLP